MRNPLRLLPFALAVPLLLHGAASLAQEAELTAARATWQRAQLRAYEYGYRKYCDCHREAPPETIVTVRDGAVTAVRHRPQNANVEVTAEQRNLEFYWTVEGLFALLDAALARGAEVRAAYDPSLGYPTEIYIDYDRDFIGDELDLRMTSVAAIARE